MSTLGNALGYASRGWLVFPLRPKSKFPATEHGFHDASDDPDDIERMWRNPACNVGLATGGGSGVWVLDVDGPIGAETLSRLEAEHGALPATPEVTTRNGRHIYFVCPEALELRSKAEHIGPKLDQRADGGYVVLPPSVHPAGGQYRWAAGRAPEDLPFAAAPGWLLKLASDPPERLQEAIPARTGSGHTRYGEKALEGECGRLAMAQEGRRNETLNEVAFRVGQLVASGHLSEGDATNEVRRAARRCGLDDREVRPTLASGLSSGLKKPNPRDPRPKEYEVGISVHETTQPAAEEAEAQTPKEDPLVILMAHEVASSALHELTDSDRARTPRTGFSRLDDVIGGYPPGTMHVVGGRTGSGKSSLLLAVALNQVQQQRHRVGIVSLEDAETVWGTRILGHIADINPNELLNVMRADEQARVNVVGRAKHAIDRAKDLGLYIAFPIGRPINWVLESVKRMVRRDGCKVIMVDYLQAIAAKGADRYIARTDAAQSLKALCHELKVPLILASQLRRPDNARPFSEPDNSHLKDSGDIENMAESILLMWPKSDEENAPVIGKVTKVKWSAGRPRFSVARHPGTGSLVGIEPPPSDDENKPQGSRYRQFKEDEYR